LESIGGYAFYWTAVEKIELPSTVKTIGQYAFSSCEKLAEVKLNEGLERIGGGAFSGTALQKVVVPFSLEEIDRTEDSEGEYIASERVFPENCELVWPDGRKIEIDEHNRNLVVHDYAKEKEYFEKKLESLKAIEGVDVGVQIAECEKGSSAPKKDWRKKRPSRLKTPPTSRSDCALIGNASSWVRFLFRLQAASLYQQGILPIDTKNDARRGRIKRYQSGHTCQ
jgi:hypothetical protein